MSIHEAPVRYPVQRLEKVSDLEIVKQGKGFKIGYIDRQGTDQRVILTKRIEAPPEMMQRDPQAGLAFKGRKILNQIYSSVLHTNGYHNFQEETKFQHSANDIEVPSIGTNPKHFDEVRLDERKDLFASLVSPCSPIWSPLTSMGPRRCSIPSVNRSSSLKAPFIPPRRSKQPLRLHPSLLVLPRRRNEIEWKWPIAGVTRQWFTAAVLRGEFLSKERNPRTRRSFLSPLVISLSHPSVSLPWKTFRTPARLPWSSPRRSIATVSTVRWKQSLSSSRRSQSTPTLLLSSAVPTRVSSLTFTVDRRSVIWPCKSIWRVRPRTATRSPRSRRVRWRWLPTWRRARRVPRPVIWNRRSYNCVANERTFSICSPWIGIDRTSGWNWPKRNWITSSGKQVSWEEEGDLHSLCWSRCPASNTLLRHFPGRQWNSEEQDASVRRGHGWDDSTTTGGLPGAFGRLEETIRSEDRSLRIEEISDDQQHCLSEHFLLAELRVHCAVELETNAIFSQHQRGEPDEHPHGRNDR